MKKRVGIWIRVSTEDQAQGDSPKMHEHRANAYAEIKGWTVVETYHLEAVSGKNVIDHPEAKRMMADVRRGHVSGLIFSKLARLARNTRQLLDFADLFQQHNADLMSLDESIDTSTPVGRFFYTIIAAMAEWERAEIGARIKASVAVRAKLGKSIGGQAPYGYKWENKQLVLNPQEAPVRKLVYELFLKHKRKKTVARILNEQGYRARKGEKITDTLINRILRDPIAKGIKRVNYTESKGNKTGWTIKPKEDWVFVESPRIVSDELWDSCNKILEEMARVPNKVRRKGVHLFSGIVQCECGAKMYMRMLSPSYVCRSCKNKIKPDDLEEIFHGQLKNFLFSDTEIKNHLSTEKLLLKDKEELLNSRTKELQKLKEKVADILELYHEGKLPKERFSEMYVPIEEKQGQIEQSIGELQGSIDALRFQTLDNSQILYDAQVLYKQWPTFTAEDKKSIIETITRSVIIGKEDIAINLSYIPTLVPDAPVPGPSERNNTTKYGDDSKTIQLSNEPRWKKLD